MIRKSVFTTSEESSIFPVPPTFPPYQVTIIADSLKSLSTRVSLIPDNSSEEYPNRNPRDLKHEAKKQSVGWWEDFENI